MRKAADTDSNVKPILKGAHTNPQVRMLHNIKVAQSRKGWKYADVEKAIHDAKAGMVYDRTDNCTADAAVGGRRG